MSTEIYYYSGTGNSLYIAKELQKRIPESKLIPMLSLLANDIIDTHGKTVGFVFPIYRMSVPAPVRKFLAKLNPKSANYIFAIPTYGNFPGPCLATVYIDRILKKSSKCLNSYFYIHMANNSPTGVMPPNFPGLKARAQAWLSEIANENLDKLDIGVQNQLNLAEKVIIKGKVSFEKFGWFSHPIFRALLLVTHRE